MAIQRTNVSIDEFEQFILRPENANRQFELIHGEIVEVVSNGYSSELAMSIGSFIKVWVLQHKLGRVTGADGGSVVNGERYIPDVAYISKTKQPTPSRDSYNPSPPDLAVEVLSPGNTPTDMRAKIFNYIEAGTVVWVVDPDEKQIEVFASGNPVQILGVDDTLDGGSVLPGFRLNIRDLFEE